MTTSKPKLLQLLRDGLAESLKTSRPYAVWQESVLVWYGDREGRLFPILENTETTQSSSKATLQVTCSDPLVRRVLQRMAMRSEAGMEKFGKTMEEAEGLSDFWIMNAQEELADAILYLEKLRETLHEKS